MYGQGGFSGGAPAPHGLGRGRGAATQPAWMSDPALAAQAQSSAPPPHPGAPGLPPPPVGAAPPWVAPGGFPPRGVPAPPYGAQPYGAPPPTHQPWGAAPPRGPPGGLPPRGVPAPPSGYVAQPPPHPMPPQMPHPPAPPQMPPALDPAAAARARALAIIQAHVPASSAPPRLLGAPGPTTRAPLSRQPPPPGLSAATMAALQRAKALAAGLPTAPAGGAPSGFSAAPAGGFSSTGEIYAGKPPSEYYQPTQPSSAVAELLAKMEDQPSTGPLLPILAKDRARKAKALEKNLAFLARLDGEGQDSEALFACDDGPAYADVPGRRQTTAGLGAKGFARGDRVAANKGENRSVYVTGLEGEFASETHLEQLFAPHGKVVKCKVYKDELDKPKGDALVTFAKGGSARQAAARCHGATLGPCVLKVELATFHSDAALRGGPVLRPDEEHWDAIVGASKTPLGLPASLDPERKPIVLLRHLYDVAQVASKPHRVFLNELEAEIRQECSKHGPVFHVVAPERVKDLEGSVAVAFETVKGAEQCALDMDGRWFDNVQILVERRGCWEDLESVQLRGVSTEVVLSLDIAPPECCVVIVHNVWTTQEAEACGSAFFDELEGEFAGECAKYGPLRSCKAVPREPSLQGAVVVAFAAAAGRDACEGDMDGRWFDFRRLRVERYSGSGAPPTPPRGASLNDFFSSIEGS